MRIIKNLETMAACCVLCLTACQQDEFRSTTSGHVPVCFAPERVTATLTRVTDDEWDDGDEIGIYMVPATSTDGDGQEENNVFEKYANEASNRPYVIAVNGDNTTLTAANNANPIYYPISGENVGFVAYYPYNDTAPEDGVYHVDVQDQSKPAASDLLYAKTTTGYNKENTDLVELNFEHRLSRLILKVVLDENINTDLYETDATLKGFPTTADFDLKTGELSNIDGEEDIVLDDVAGNTENEAKFTVILVPHPGSGYTRTVDFTIDGMVYTYVFGDEFDFTAGISNECTLTFTGTRLLFTENTSIDLDYTTNPKSIEFSSSAAVLEAYVSNSATYIDNDAGWLECDLTNNYAPDNETNWDTYVLTAYSKSTHMYTETPKSTRTAYIHLVGAAKTTVITVTQTAKRLTLHTNTTNVNVSAGASTGNTFTIKTNWPSAPTVSTSGGQIISEDHFNIDRVGEPDQDGFSNWDITFGVTAMVVPENTYCPIRNAAIKVTCGDLVKTIDITQSAHTTNVSDGMSNCYVLDSQGSVTFSVKRAYADDGTTLRVDGDKYEGTFDVELLWYNEDVVSSYEVEGTGPDAKITIIAGTGTGNAVVALKREYGDIVWSYHIWRSNVKIVNGWLDRSLGSEHAEDGTLTRAGNVYQWGRKDPFPGTFTFYEPTDVTGWGLMCNTDISLENSIHNPTTFITSESWGGCDGEQSWEKHGRKSVHDPCPAGYWVPLSHEFPASHWVPYVATEHGTMNPVTTLMYEFGFMRSKYDGTLWAEKCGWWSRTRTNDTTAYATLAMLAMQYAYFSPDMHEECAYGCSVRCIAETTSL